MDPDLRRRVPLLGQPQLFSLRTRVLHAQPPIVRISEILSPAECAHIISLAQPHLAPSTQVIDGKLTVNTARTSSTAFITKNGCASSPSGREPDDPVVAAFLQRLAALCGMPISHFEGMMVVNYQQHQHYDVHWDFFRDAPAFTPNGDRRFTFFVYLNTLAPEDGGCTHFPRIGLRVRPQQGDALFWVNRDFAGAFQDDTEHCAEPVLCDDNQKWGVNVWVRERPYVL